MVTISCLAVAVAMDWDTAAEVATCQSHGDYQTLAARAGALLRQHQIDSKLMYFAKPDKDGIEGLTNEPAQANRWGLYVHVRDAPEARRVLARAIKQGLRITLSTKDPTPEISGN